jgi:hypothetical protein
MSIKIMVQGITLHTPVVIHDTAVQQAAQLTISVYYMILKV